MIGKVKITQEQGIAVENWLKDFDNDKERLLENHAERGGKWVGGYSHMNELSQADMARALLIGYDVEPEYKIGDWVVRVGGGPFNAGHIAAQVAEVNRKSVILDGPEGTFSYGFVRHATPEEIKAEKERQFWAKLGRKVGEFKEGDTAIGRNNHIWRRPENMEREYERHTMKGFYPADSFVSFENED